MTASLHLRAPVADGRFRAPVLTATAGPPVPRLLVGRTPAEALALVGRLYSLCGGAHAVAGAMACEAALGLRASAVQVAARHIIVLAECLGELALGVLRDWPLLLGTPPRLEAARTLRAALAPVPGLLYGAGPWAVPGGAPLYVQPDALAARLAEARAVVWAEVFGRTDLAAWAQGDDPGGNRGDGPARQMMDHLRAHGLEGFGRLPASLPALPAGPLARRADHPRVAAVLARHGSGLLAHVTARLADIAATLEMLERTVSVVYDETPRPALVPPLTRGDGWTEAARGTLGHSVWLTGQGRIAAWAVDAPTDRNFHPSGPLVRGLTGAAAGTDEATARQRAALLVAALDPCVACEIEVPVHA